MRRLTVCGAALLAALLLPPFANAQDFYKGKTLEVYVGYGPGGGYDQYGRMLARHIVRFLPGHPEAIVRNMPGAGSTKMANYLHDVAPKDGTQIGIAAATVAFDPLLGADNPDAVKFDPRTLSWIGSLDQFSPIGIAWKGTGITTLEDAKHKELILGTSGGDTSSVYPRLLNSMIGTKFKIIQGYRGSADITLAMEKGELTGFVGWYWYGLKTQKPHWMEQNLVTLFLQLGVEPDPEMQGVPWVMDVLPNERDKQTFKLVLANLALSRPFMAPPGVPPERLRVLRDAFNAMAKDPEFLAEAQAQQASIRPYTGEQIDALLKDVYATPPDIVADVKKATAQQ